MNRKFLACTVSAAALSIGVATAAMAATTTLNGGGSTLAQPTYTQEFNTYTSSAPTVLFSYDGVGSGGGTSAFLNNNIALFNSPTNQYGTIVGTTVDFGASDAYLSSSQVTSTGGYTLSATDGPLIQLPMFGTPITFPFVNAGLTTKVGSKKAPGLTITDAQMCGILSGQITNWSQLSSKATAGTIEVAYRSDGSGTTFLLTQHLNAVCTASNSSFPAYPVPITKTFTQLFTGGSVPTNFTGESGSALVQSYLLATPLSFGYLSPDYTSIAPKSANTSSLKVATVVNGINGVGYQPTVANTNTGLSNAGPGSTNATPPSTPTTAADPLLWVPSVPQTNKGYSIVGYTVWILSSCYADKTAGTDLDSFLKKHFATKSYQTLIENNGFSPLANTAAAPYVSAIDDDFLTNTSGYDLNIDGPQCSAYAGR
jgi:ABC-type phosphate transport system substrate-binding protein